MLDQTGAAPRGRADTAPPQPENRKTRQTPQPPEEVPPSTLGAYYTQTGQKGKDLRIVSANAIFVDPVLAHSDRGHCQVCFFGSEGSSGRDRVHEPRALHSPQRLEEQLR